jgi:hypothetical protein
MVRIADPTSTFLVLLMGQQRGQEPFPQMLTYGSRPLFRVRPPLIAVPPDDAGNDPEIEPPTDSPRVPQPLRGPTERGIEILVDSADTQVGFQNSDVPAAQ